MVLAPRKELNYISRKAVFTALAAGMILSSFLLAGCGSTEDKTKTTAKEEIAVELKEVAQKDISTFTRVSGKLSPSQEVVVTLKGVGGKVTQIPVDIGDKVKKGDLLVALDAGEISQQVRQAEASLAMVRANGTIQLEQIDSQAKQAELRYNDAKINLDRMETLFKEGAVSLQQLEQARTNYDAALSAYQVTQTQLGLINGGTNYSRNAVQAQVKQAEAALALAQLSLNNATMIAPVSGTIGGRNIDPGEVAVPGVPLVTIVNLDKVIVEASVSESTITKLKQGQLVDVKIPAALDKPFKGTLTSLSPNADPRTKSYPVKIVIENPEGHLKAGMYAELVLQTEIKENIVVIPKEAVVNKNGRNVVYVIKENKAQEVPVEVGITNGSEVEIIRGLQKGEKLVVVGQQALYNQAPVKVTGGK